MSQRFWKHVKVLSENECWLWQGRKVGKGYGGYSVGGKNVRAHRYAYEQQFGDAGDLDVLHSCHNKLCCNPKHLKLGTNQENKQDSDFAKLSSDQVQAIRARYIPRDKEHNSVAISKDYSVGSRQIRRIISNESWGNI